MPEIKRPMGSKVPHVLGSGSIWVNILPRKLDKQSTIQSKSGRIVTTFATDPDGEIASSFKFLAPEVISENIQHSWEEYTSISSKTAEYYTGLQGQLEQIKGTLEPVVDAIKKTIKNRTLQSVAISNVTQQFKIDTPLIYQGSARRRINLTFDIIDEGIGDESSYEDVVKPVEKLIKYSTGDIGIGGRIELPYIFRVVVGSIGRITKEYIYIRNAAITNIQPTYYNPGRGGFPSRCVLEVTFSELDPLWRSSYNKQLLNTRLR